MSDGLVTVTEDGYNVKVRHPHVTDQHWEMSFPAANQLHAGLSKVLTDNMITQIAPFSPEQYSESIATHILADLDQAMDEADRTKMPLVERLSWFRKIISGSDYGL